ncbi:MAG TPA: alpha/beta hydrolase [Candidatus Solibacter sp.]|jgi:pimeloyl-ACP methyl ester carboxylesterase|nr:alpha/beta hydrolase [Candidatus Solibacter sp.]
MVYTTQSADGTTIAYERSGDGPPLILVGGALNNRHSAAAHAALLEPRFSVIRYDRRGRGDSGDTPPYAPAREVEDLRALIDAAGGAAFVFGHSSGAVLALETAAAGAPITRLAVNEPPYLTDVSGGETSAATAREVQEALDRGDRGSAVEIFLRSTGAPFDPAIKESPWWPAMTAVAHTLPYDLAIVGNSQVPTERLARISIPTLGLYGGASPSWAHDSIAAVTAAIPGAAMKVLEGQTHASAPEVLVPVLIEFFG